MDQGQSNTGTRDSTYDLVAVLYHALQGAENCQTYSQDASSDPQIGQFFQQALQMQRQLADQAKMLLHDRLMQETGGGQGGMSEGMSGGGSAFQFSGDQSQSGMGGGSGMGQSGDMQTSGSDQFGTSR
jgi:uncharacterized membrane protein YgcG